MHDDNNRKLQVFKVNLSYSEGRKAKDKHKIFIMSKVYAGILLSG